jgi:hypothetical protein
MSFLKTEGQESKQVLSRDGYLWERGTGTGEDE